MKNLNDVFAAFKLNKSDVIRLSKEAKEAAVNDGMLGATNRLDPETTREIFYRMAEKFYVLPDIPDYALNFELYEIFPCKYAFLDPVYCDMRDEEIEDPAIRGFIWQQFLKFLSMESCHADPIKNVLSNVFFRSRRLTRLAWRELMNCRPQGKALYNLLEAAGPVPWDLKEPVYYKLLKDQDSHFAIFHSLYNSACGPFGQVDKKHGYLLLQKLRVRIEDPYHEWILQKLDKPFIRRKMGKKDNSNDDWVNYKEGPGLYP